MLFLFRDLTDEPHTEACLVLDDMAFQRFVPSELLPDKRDLRLKLELVFELCLFNRSDFGGLAGLKAVDSSLC